MQLLLKIFINFLRCSFTSDIFSFGLLLCSFFKIKHEKSTSSPYYLDCRDNIHSYKEKVKNYYTKNLFNYKVKYF